MGRFVMRVLRDWIPLAVVAVVLSALVYVAVQQSYRMSANDPQIQMAQDAARSVFSGDTPDSVIPTGTIDIAKSLAPFIIVYDHAGTPIAGDGFLNGDLPKPPIGVLKAADSNPQGNRVTWQPRAGVRVAAVAVAADQSKRSAEATGGLYYVVVARSLREVEIRENNLTQIVGAALGITLVATLAAILLLEWLVAVVERRSQPAPVEVEETPAKRPSGRDSRRSS